MSSRLNLFLKKHAPGYLGAVLVSTVLLASTACKKSTPDWDTPGGAAPPAEQAVAPAPAPLPVVPPPVAPPPVVPVAPEAVTDDPNQLPPEAIEAPTEATEGLRFIAYNVENWLTMDREVDRKRLKDAPKPDAEKQAVVSILRRQIPDVVGLCEIGTADDLADLQGRLKAAGLDLPHSVYVGGADPTRHLGLLSRFPIVSQAKPAVTEYQLNGEVMGIQRGILDATIEGRGKSYRFIGVHLKSKRDIKEADQDQMRLQEGMLLRAHVDTIFTENPDARLIVYGDFNDTRGSRPFKAITGTYKSPTYLMPIPAKDSNGEFWTHFWQSQDVYSRIDFITISPAMKRETNFGQSRVLDDAEWSTGSDHRPVMGIFR